MEKFKILATQNDDNLFAVLHVNYFKNCGYNIGQSIQIIEKFKHAILEIQFRFL